MDNNQAISILIIEDNPGDQFLLRENLLSTNLLIADITSVETLKEGATYLSSRDFSLVFLDLFLPDSTGLDSFTELIKINPHVPVIIYSGLSDTQIALHAIALGAQDFLIKGDFSASLLEKAARYSIERKSNLDELERSNERYNLISKATHDMVWDWDLIKSEVQRNIDGWRKIFRTSEDKVITSQEDWRSKIHPDDRDRVLSVYNSVDDDINNAGRQELFEVECRILRDDGTIGHIEDRGYIIRNAAGKAIRIIGASHDITDRKMAEEKVLLREQRFRALVQNGSDLIGIIDQKGIYKHAGGSLKRALGYEIEYLIDKTPYAFIYPEDLWIIREALSNIKKENFIQLAPFRYKNAAGELRWMQSTFTNLVTETERSIIVNSRDITESKLAADEIEKLSLVAKETINGVIIIDKNLIIQWVNNAFTKLSGYTLEEVIGKCPLSFLIGVETDPEVVNYAKVQARHKNPFVFEILNYTKAGKKIFVRVQVQPLFDEQGVIKQYFALQTDITKERELEEKVQFEKILKQKEITDAVFTAQENERSDIGRELHDNVNQLLGAIRLYIDMAKNNEKDRNSLLTSASGFSLTAIEEIRKLSKVLVTPLIKEIGLVDSVKDLAEEIMLVHPIQIELAITKFSEKGLNDKFKLNIFRIVQEQINNALKHAQAKHITINIEEKSGRILISVTDDGIGFDTATKKSGIGLTNIKSRCELYNGTVLLLSEPGKGTSLSMTYNKKDVLNGNQK